MMTIEGLIAIISLVLTALEVIKHKNNRLGPEKTLGDYLLKHNLD